MDLNESSSQVDPEISTSFNDYCIHSGFDNPNDVNHLKADNFNLRLRCYNLDQQLMNCKCFGNKPNEGTSVLEDRDKLENFINRQKELQEQNEYLIEENLHLKDRINETNISELKSLQNKYEHLQRVTDEKIQSNELVKNLFKENEELIEKNVSMKQEIYQLKSTLINLKKQNFNAVNESKKSNNLSFLHQSNVMKDFNDSMELSKNISKGCFQCNALKVNYDKLYGCFVEQVDKQESLSRSIRSLKDKNSELENEIVILKSLPVIDQEKQKKYKLLIKEALTGIARKDNEIKMNKDDTKKLIDYFMNQMGILNDTIDRGKKNVTDQVEAMKSIHSVLENVAKVFSIELSSGALNPIDAIKDDNKKYSVLKENWLFVTHAMKNLLDHIIANRYVKENIDVQQNVSFRENAGSDQESSVLLQKIVTEFEVVKDMSKSLQDLSSRFNDSQGLEEMSVEGTSLSPQYKKYAKCHPGQIDKRQSESFRLGKISLDATAYQSVIGDSFFADINSFDVWDQVQKKIEELGGLIRQYANLVEHRDLLDVSATMVDKSCLVSIENQSQCKSANISSVNLSESPTRDSFDSNEFILFTDDP